MVLSYTGSRTVRDPFPDNSPRIANACTVSPKKSNLKVQLPNTADGAMGKTKTKEKESIRFCMDDTVDSGFNAQDNASISIRSMGSSLQ